jgi:3-keto-5-aminohexanoate cleavage enzyme
MRKLIIEVRVNEYRSRKRNPHVPLLADEIAVDAAECREAGAAIVHFHARMAGGQPDHAPGAQADVIRAIRARSDVLVHPTLGNATADGDAAARIAPIVALAADAATRPDLVPFDMGSVNLDWYDARNRRFPSRGAIYANGTDTLEHFARTAGTLGLKPCAVIWNVSFMRQALAFIEMGLVPEPAFLCFCLTDGGILAGHPATAAGLAALTAFLPDDRRVEWTACAVNASLLPLTESIILAGGHVSIGLGDHPFTELGQPTNADLVRRVAAQARALGRDVASPADARAMLGIT